MCCFACCCLLNGVDAYVRICVKVSLQEVKAPKSNWRAKHEDFINTVRAARGVSIAMQRGEPLPPPPPPSLNPGKRDIEFNVYFYRDIA